MSPVQLLFSNVANWLCKLQFEFSFIKKYIPVLHAECNLILPHYGAIKSIIEDLADQTSSALLKTKSCSKTRKQESVRIDQTFNIYKSE